MPFGVMRHGSIRGRSCREVTNKQVLIERGVVWDAPFLQNLRMDDFVLDARGSLQPIGIAFGVIFHVEMYIFD